MAKNIKSRRRKIRSATKQKIILLLCAGLQLSLTRSPKHAWRLAKKLPKQWQQIDRHELYRSLKDFYQQDVIDYQEADNGAINIVLTKDGERLALEFNFDTMKLEPAKKWDGQWRVVLYDIPHAKRVARDALHRKLRELGFYEWQKSVLIYPFPCRDEIDFIVEFFELRPFVRYAELSSPTNEAELKLHFNLR